MARLNGLSPAQGSRRAAPAPVPLQLLQSELTQAEPISHLLPAAPPLQLTVLILLALHC